MRFQHKSIGIIAIAYVFLSGIQCGGPVDADRSFSLVKSTLTISDFPVPSGTSATITLALKDASGAAVRASGLEVAFSLDSGASTGEIGPVTDAGDGSYSAVFTGKLAGNPATLRAKVNGRPIPPPLLGIQVVPGAPSLSNSRVTVGGEVLVVGSSAWVKLDVRDAAGNKVPTPGAVALELVDGTSTGTLAPLVDGGQGTFYSTFVAGTAGLPLTIAATINGNPLTSALPQLRVVNGSLTQLSVVTVSRNIVPSGETANITLQLKNVANKNVPGSGHDVQFSVSGGTSTGTMTAVEDHGDGTYTARFTGALAGTPVSIAATIDGEPVATNRPSITVRAGAFSLATSTVEVASNVIAIGQGVWLSLTARDAVGNSLTYDDPLTVEFNTDAGFDASIGTTYHPQPGRYTAVLTAQSVGTTTIGATVNGNPVLSPRRPLTSRLLPEQPYASHEPAGWRLVSYRDMSGISQGWELYTSDGGELSVSDDPGAPGSAPHVGAFRFPAGRGGVSTWTKIGSPSEVYVAYWWKAGTGSVGFSGGDGVQGSFEVRAANDAQGRTILAGFIHSQSCDRAAAMNGSIGGERSFLPGHAIPITPGEWYRVEIYYERNREKTTPTGILRWWINGELGGDYSNLCTGAWTAWRWLVWWHPPGPITLGPTRLPRTSSCWMMCSS